MHANDLPVFVVNYSHFHFVARLTDKNRSSKNSSHCQKSVQLFSDILSFAQLLQGSQRSLGDDGLVDRDQFARPLW